MYYIKPPKSNIKNSSHLTVSYCSAHHPLFTYNPPYLSQSAAVQCIKH